MKQFQPGQSVKFFGRPVTIRTVYIRIDGGMSYLCEGEDGGFFRARHESLSVPSIRKEFADHAVPFQDICSRATCGNVQEERRANV